MYSCEVIEFGSSIEVKLVEDILYIDCYSIYNDKGYPIKDINIDRFGDSIHVINNELWITFSSDPQNIHAKRVDIESLDYVSNLPHAYSKGIVKTENRYFEVVGRRENTKITCISEAAVTVNIPWLKHELFSNKNKIFVFDRNGGLFCFDSALNSVWSIKCEKRITTTNLNLYHPIFFNDSIICNLGRGNADGDNDFHVCSYNTITGNVICNLVLESPLQSSFLVGEYLYFSTQRYFYKVFAVDGCVEIKHEIIYETFDKKDSVISAVYPVKDGILCFNHQNHFVELRSEDAKTVLQKIKLPETYAYSLLSSPPVLEFGENYYFGLDHLVVGLNPMKSAVAVLTIDRDAPQYCDATLESRPPYLIEVVKGAAGKNEHLVKMTGNDHNKILRYAHVVLKEIAFKCGVTRLFEFDSRDKNHGGVIILEIDTSALEKPQSITNWDSFFSVIKNRVETELRDSHVLAGDGESHFTVELQIK